MSKSKSKIPILGIDKRPLKRQATPGLCEEIINLRPSGPKEQPFWEAVPGAGPLVNDDEQPYSGDPDTVAAHWQIRSRIGEGADDQSASLERLIIGKNDGTIDIVDPNKGSGWEVFKTFNIGSASEDWQYSFANINDTVVVAVSKDGVPDQNYYLQDDSLITPDIPDLPRVDAGLRKLSFKSQAAPPVDVHGLRGGWYALRYGFRTSGGSVLKLSLPHYLEVPEYEDKVEKSSTGIVLFVTSYFTAIDIFARDPFPSFDDLPVSITGIDFFLSERKDSKKELLEATYYKVKGADGWSYSNPYVFVGGKISTATDLGEYDYPKEGKNYNDISKKNTIFSYEKEDDDIPAGQTMDLDDFSAQKISAAVVSSYNSRLIMGNTKTEFSTYENFRLADEGVLIDFVKSDGFNTSQRSLSVRFRAVNGCLFSDDDLPTTNTGSVDMYAKEDYFDVSVDNLALGTFNIEVDVPTYSYGSDREDPYKISEPTFIITITI